MENAIFGYYPHDPDSFSVSFEATLSVKVIGSNNLPISGTKIMVWDRFGDKDNPADFVLWKAKKEEAELGILKSYLPKEASPDEIKQIVKGIIEETGASSKKDFGKVMKAAMEKLKGACDGKTVSSIINELLGN